MSADAPEGAHDVERGWPEPSAVAAFCLGAVPVAPLGFADGGFHARPWSWATLGLAWAVVVTVLLGRRPAISRRSLTLLALLAALGVWLAASLAWTRSGSLTVPELQRLLLYVAGVGAAVLVVSTRTWRSLLAGVLAGTSTVVVWGLISYLVTRERVPDAFEGYLLHVPMGYANAMAVTAVMAILLALGFVTDADAAVVRCACAMLLVPLAAALVLTGSRAGWAALFLGGAVSIAVTPARVKALKAWALVLIMPALAAGLVATADVNAPDVTGARADRLGDRVLAAIVLLTAGALLPALRLVRRPIAPGSRATRRLLTVAVVSLICALVAVLVVRSPDLGGDRPTYWRVALAEYSEHPVLGTGAGTYQQVWLERRPNATSVRDAHSVVVEALAELGLVGLALVVLLLAAPMVWGCRARLDPLIPGTLAAFAAYAAHASVDWDWEMPAVTLAALFCAVALAVAADGQTGVRSIGSSARALAGVGAGVVGVLAVAGLIGSSALERAERSLASGDPAGALQAARRAERWQPWSVEPLLVRGRAELTLSDRASAHASFTRAVRREPNDYRSWLGLASVSEGEEASSAVLRARELNPNAVRSTAADSP